MSVLVDDVVEFAGDLVVHTAEIGPLEALLPFGTQALHELAQTLETFTVGILETVLHQPTQSRVDVSVIQQFVGEFLEERIGIEIESAGLEVIPKNTVEIEESDAGTLIKLLDAIEDQDDVNEVHANFDIPEEILEKLA